MWERNEYAWSGTHDETAMIPAVTESDDDTRIGEKDYVKQARERGITIGMAIALVALMLCMCGVAIGSALTRILVL